MGKTLSREEINHIIYLRKHGHSLPEIRRITSHANSTVFKYIQEIKILPEFQELWRNKRKSSVFRMIQEQQKARAQAEKILNKKELNKREKIIIAACLYCAEGEKKSLSLSNTDPALMRTFVDCIRELGISKEKLRINIRIYEDLDRKKVCNYWPKAIGVPKKQIVSVNVLNGKKQGKLKYGMCRIRVIKGGYFLKLLHALGDIILRRM